MRPSFAFVFLLSLSTQAATAEGFWIFFPEAKAVEEAAAEDEAPLHQPQTEVEMEMDLKGKLVAEEGGATKEDEDEKGAVSQCFPGVLNPGCFLNQFVPWSLVCQGPGAAGIWKQCEVMAVEEERGERSFPEKREEEQELEVLPQVKMTEEEEMETRRFLTERVNQVMSALTKEIREDARKKAAADEQQRFQLEEVVQEKEEDEGVPEEEMPAQKEEEEETVADADEEKEGSISLEAADEQYRRLEEQIEEVFKDFDVLPMEEEKGDDDEDASA